MGEGTAVLFAVGAVSGTVLSFELGLLWPTFMLHAGQWSGCRSRSRAAIPDSATITPAAMCFGVDIRSQP